MDTTPTHTPTDDHRVDPAPVALVTGASRGLGAALARGLVERGWHVVIDGRDPQTLRAAATGIGSGVEAIPGDVTDPEHRRALAAAVSRHGRLDLLVSNASALGPSPLPALADVDAADLRSVLDTNVVAPLMLFAAVRPALQAAHGVVVHITSDAASGPWPGWGVYGASKAALDQATNVLGAEHPELAVYAVDPGDMRTAMHQAAFPGEDISDRPEPSAVVPAILGLVDRRPPSGRYRAADLPVRAGA